MADAVAIGDAGRFAEGAVVGVAVGNRRLAIVRTGGRLYCVDDLCPHDECLLSEYGEVTGDRLVCTCHMSTFDVRTGAAISGPAYGDATVHPVELRGDEVFVQLASDEAGG